MEVVKPVLLALLHSAELALDSQPTLGLVPLLRRSELLPAGRQVSVKLKRPVALVLPPTHCLALPSQRVRCSVAHPEPPNLVCLVELLAQLGVALEPVHQLGRPDLEPAAPYSVAISSRTSHSLAVPQEVEALERVPSVNQRAVLPAHLGHLLLLPHLLAAHNSLAPVCSVA